MTAMYNILQASEKKNEDPNKKKRKFHQMKKS